MALLPGDDAPYLFESLVPSAGAGLSLLDLLESRFSYRDRSDWSRRVEDGDVFLDGIPAREPGRILREGERLGCLARDFREPDVPTDWTIAVRGEDWMCVSKPSGMPVHSTPRIYRQSLVWQVRKLWGEGWTPAHRLDRDTSGLVLLARGRELPRWLGRAFARRAVEKEYIALVRGALSGPVRVDAAIGLADDPRIPLRRIVRPDGQEACTFLEPLADDPLGRGTWIRARPLQGRTHQIRVHCLHAGLPIEGDLLYDGREGEGYLRRAAGEEVGTRLHLHAWKLRFRDLAPGTLPRELVGPPPPDWNVPTPP